MSIHLNDVEIHIPHNGSDIVPAEQVIERYRETQGQEIAIPVLCSSNNNGELAHINSFAFEGARVYEFYSKTIPSSIGNESNDGSLTTNGFCYDVAERTISQLSDFSAANDYATREIEYGTSRSALDMKRRKKSMNHEESIHDLSRAIGELLTELEYAKFGTLQNGLDIFQIGK